MGASSTYPAHGRTRGRNAFIQGGNANIWSGTRVAYPIAFTSVFSTVITKNANADSEYGFYDVDKWSFRFKINTDNAWNIYWLAVGY